MGKLLSKLRQDENNTDVSIFRCVYKNGIKLS